jgi:hypothetical protein
MEGKMADLLIAIILARPEILGTIFIVLGVALIFQKFS